MSAPLIFRKDLGATLEEEEEGEPDLPLGKG